MKLVYAVLNVPSVAAVSFFYALAPSKHQFNHLVRFIRRAVIIIAPTAILKPFCTHQELPS